MIQVFFDNQIGARIDLSDGYLEVASEYTSIEITTGTSTIVVQGQAMMERSEEGFVLAVSDGTVNFDGMEMESGSIIALDSYGEINTNPIISMTSFGPSAYVLGLPGEAVSVVFSWNSFFFNPDTYVIVEIAADRRFNRILETRDIGVINGTATDGDAATSVSISLESGSYWWRAYPASAESRTPINSFFPSGTLEVIPVAAALLLSPPNTAELVFPVESVIPLSWTVVEGASAYLVEISARADMSAPAVSRRVLENSVTQTGLDFGRWYWRVTPVFPPHFRGSAAASATGEFSVIRGSPILAAPVLTFPPSDGKVFIESSSRLMWNHDPAAAFWIVELADNSTMANPVIRQNAASNFFPLLSTFLYAGKTWYWRITAMGGAEPAVSDIWKFEVSSGSQPVVGRPVLSTIPQLPPIIFGGGIDNWDDLDPEAAANNDRVLSRIVRFLEVNTEYRLRVEGHANPTVDPHDTEARRREYTEELQPMSEIRARAIVGLLVTLGADPNRLEYRGLGGERPMAAWEDRANWWRNRRVEFILFK
jgi:hypothetical protein